MKEKAEALHQSGVWPKNPPAVRSTQWLDNFPEPEQEIAAALLDIFIHFSEDQVTQVLERALRRLLEIFGDAETDTARRTSKIESELENSVFVPVESEYVNPTDSGNYISRRSRQILELPEAQVAEPRKGLEYYLSGKNIVFVDDLVGTGSQMRSTWRREYSETDPKSFDAAFRSIGRKCNYVCLACTKTGKRALSHQAKGITVVAAHELDQRDRFEAFLGRIPDHPQGDRLVSSVESLLRRYAIEWDLESYMSQDEYSKFGFGNLGFSIAFQHSIPDCTLPIYWANGRENWVPLKKRV